MSLTLHLFLLIISSLVLVKATTLIIKALGKLSSFFGLREFSVAFILMATATSLPELFVGITSALEGAPTLSLGNVLGSNIVNLALVTGVVVLASGGIQARSIIVRRDSLLMAIYALVPVVLLYDKVISRGDGLIMLFFYALYVFKLVSQRSSLRQLGNHVTAKQAVLNMGVFLLGVTVLLGSAAVLVRSAREIAEGFNVSLGLVGVLFISLGTSLPEIVFELKAVKKQSSSLALGDLVGSVVSNATLVLGITALIYPIHVESLQVFLAPIIYLLVVLLVFEIFVRTDKKLVVWEGLFLIMIYIAFLLTELGLGYLG